MRCVNLMVQAGALWGKVVLEVGLPDMNETGHVRRGSGTCQRHLQGRLIFPTGLMTALDLSRWVSSSGTGMCWYRYCTSVSCCAAVCTVSTIRAFMSGGCQFESALLCSPPS